MGEIIDILKKEFKKQFKESALLHFGISVIILSIAFGILHDVFWRELLAGLIIIFTAHIQNILTDIRRSQKGDTGK